MITAAGIVLPAALGIGPRADSPTPASSEAVPVIARGPLDAVDAMMRVSVMLEGSGTYGSGVLIDPARGTVLTAYHVVEDMRAPKVTGYGGATSSAEILDFDKDLDLAVLRAKDLADPALPAPPLAAASALRRGEDLYAIGMPRKLSFSVARGVVADPDRELQGDHFLQVDMNINDGNSGGPVFTSRGEVVGVMSFILRRSEGLSFASPMEDAATRFSAHIPAVR